MKILMFSGDYWPNNGGIAAHVYYLSRAIGKVGADVTIVGGMQEEAEFPGESDVSTDSSVHEITIKRKGPRLIRGFLFLAQGLLALWRLSDEKWDIIHFHNFVPDGLLLGIFSWPKAKARIMTNHSSQYLTALSRDQSTLLFRITTRTINGFIAPSEELLQKTAPIMKPGQVACNISNGVDVEHFAPADPTERAYEFLDVDKQRKIILSVRRHTAKCGLEYLLRAVPAVVREHPEAVFCFVGDGEQTSELKEIASELKVSEHVRFPGRVSHTELPDVLRASYVTILPSLFEAVSLAGLESMACGIPVIGTKVGGIPEFVMHEDTGILVEPGSSDSIARAIVGLLENPQLHQKMSIRARELVAQRFSWENTAKMVMDFYESMDTTP